MFYRDHALWARFDPKLNPDGPKNPWADDVAKPGDSDSDLDGPGNSSRDAPAWSGNAELPVAQGLKTKFTNKAGPSSKPVKSRGQQPSASALEAAALKFPDIVPPSTESLSASAPLGVLEDELRRLLGDWNQALEVLGDLVADKEDNNIGGGGDAHVDTAARAVGGRVKATPKHKQGYGHARGRARGPGDDSDMGLSIGDLSISGDDDFNLYPTNVEKSSNTAGDETPDTTTPVPPVPQVQAPAKEE